MYNQCYPIIRGDDKNPEATTKVKCSIIMKETPPSIRIGEVNYTRFTLPVKRAELILKGDIPFAEPFSVGTGMRNIASICISVFATYFIYLYIS